jgi:hypothetical protein
MKDTFTSDFFTWLDQHPQADLNTVAEKTGNDRNTISGWRSRGIPKGKRYACQAMMLEFSSPRAPQNAILMRPSYEPFQRWNRAALDSGQTIEDWAFEGLEELAARHFANKPAGSTPYALPDPADSHVAEDPPDFNGDEDPPDLEE